MRTKIPPPIWMMVFVGLSWVITWQTPHYIYGWPYQMLVVWIFVAGGVIFPIAGVMHFIKGKTTVNPHTPHKTSALISNGVYRVTRNPMYLGMLFLIIAITLKWGNPLALLAPIGFVITLNKLQIEPEEEALTKLFGEDYAAYKKSVRRWL